MLQQLKEKAIQEAKRKYDVVIVMPHRGREYTEKGMGVRVRYVHLSADNVLNLSSAERCMKFQLWKTGKMVNSSAFRFLIRCVRKGKRLIQ